MTKDNHSQRKKGDDSSRGNHLETQSKAGEEKEARINACNADNHAGTIIK